MKVCSPVPKAKRRKCNRKLGLYFGWNCNASFWFASKQKFAAYAWIWVAVQRLTFKIETGRFIPWRLNTVIILCLIGRTERRRWNFFSIERKGRSLPLFQNPSSVCTTIQLILSVPQTISSTDIFKRLTQFAASTQFLWACRNLIDIIFHAQFVVREAIGPTLWPRSGNS